MTSLSSRKTRLVFETGDCIRERGKLREVVIEAHPGYAIVRLKGTRKTFTFSWGALYQAAAKLEAIKMRAEKFATKPAKKGTRR